MFGSEQTWRCIGGWKRLVNLFNYIHQMSFVYRFFLFPTLEIGSPCVDFHLNYCHFFFSCRRLFQIYMTYFSNPAGGKHINALFLLKQQVQEDTFACRYGFDMCWMVILLVSMLLLTLLTDKVWILIILFVVHSLPRTGESWKHGFMLAVK